MPTQVLRVLESLAVKLIMLKPRNAKKVSAMLPTMSLTGG